jgi:hypothetical protein
MQVEFETSVNIGKSEIEVLVLVTADCLPAELMVRYYKDGSGYPGCPASVEITGLTALAATGAYGKVLRTPKNEEWFLVLDSFLYTMEDHFIEQSIEEANGDEF